ncbi:MAG: tetratricopeptide repeat protein [Limisphaerales bacterium]
MSHTTSPGRMSLRGPARPVWQGGLILLLVFLAYLPALRGGFIWDDDSYVTENTTLHNLDGLRRIWFDPGALPQYYPLVHTTFWLEYHLWGFNPFGYHLVNVLLHAIAAILFGVCCLRLRIPGAWLAAAIFALHPVCVESVVWITERKNVLSAVCYFAAALAYLRYAGLEEAVTSNRRRWRYYWGALALFAAALSSKTVACSLPAALLLVIWWKKGCLRANDILPSLPFFAIGAAGGLATAWIEKHHVGAQGAEWSLTFADRCLIAGRALWFYAGKLVWPVQLTFIYPRWKIEADVWWQWLFPAAAVCVVAGLWLVRHRIGKGPLVAVLFFAGTLGPALGFINVFPMRYSFVADHFQYLAAGGLIALCAAGLRRLPRVAPAMLVVVLGVLTWRQADTYRDLETLWRTTLARNPDCCLAHNNLGVLLNSEGHTEEAIEHFQKAVRLSPDYCEALNNLGSALANQGQFDEAIENFRQAARFNPNDFKALCNLGLALANKGRLDEAIEAYRQATRINPNFSDALDNLGNTLAAKGRLDEAIENYRQAIRVNSNRPETFFHLGMTLDQLGRTREAVAQYREALKLNPNLAGALNNLAWVLATSPDDQLRNGTEAVRLAEQACELTHYREPLFIGTLAAAYAEAGRFPEAVTTAEKAEQLATSAGLTAVAAKNHELLELYQAGKPHHEPAPAGH